MTRRDTAHQNRLHNGDKRRHDDHRRDTISLILIAARVSSRLPRYNRRRRQAEGQAKAKVAGLYKGRQENRRRNDGIAAMLRAGSSWQQVMDATGCSRHTVAKARKRLEAASAAGTIQAST